MGAKLTDEYLRHMIKLLKKSARENRFDCRPGKRRFGLYDYLSDLYAVYLELKSKGLAKKAARKLIKRLHLRVQRGSHPIRVSLKHRQGRKMHAKRAVGPRLFVMYSVGKHRPKKQNIILSGDRELLDARRNRLPTSVEPGSEHWQQTAI